MTNNELPGDPNLPPGVSQRDLDRQANGPALRFCLACGDELEYYEVGLCGYCKKLEDEDNE